MQTRDILAYKDGYLSTALVHSVAIERVILAMRERLHEPLSLQDMADIAHMSPYHFNRVFHRLIGVPPGEFLTALRLDAAKRLLLTTSLSVTDICFEVGYLSPSSFTTRFTQLVGLPPRQLRQVAGDYTMPCPESLQDISTYTFCHVPFRGCFFGRISAPVDFTGLIYIGVFPKPIPQGRPCSCALLSAPGIYFIKSFMRWFTIAPKEQKGIEIALLLPHPAMHGEEGAQRLMEQVGKNPTWSYGVDDCRKTYEEFLAKGVKFSSPPTEQFYGTEAVCEDLYGNSISMVEPSPAMIERMQGR